jgi:hypothetical protein
MPYGGVLKDERPTSNIERPTSNERTNIQYRTFNGYFCFLICPHSTFDVGRSMFDVHLFQSLLGKNNLALMGQGTRNSWYLIEQRSLPPFPA